MRYVLKYCVQCNVNDFIKVFNTIGLTWYRIRIRIFIIPINVPTIGANKLHTLIIVIGGNYTYIYIQKKYINTMFLVGFRALTKINNLNRKRKNISLS